MALDCIIDVDCEVKRQLTREGLVAMIKQRARAEAMINVVTKGGKSGEEALRHRFKLRVMTPGGIEETEQTISDLLESTRHLETIREQCLRCSLRVDGMYDTLFGAGNNHVWPYCCYHIINYPISRKAEAWLAEKARQAMAKGGVNAMATDLILEKKIAGRQFRALRAARHSMFLELKKPLEVSHGNGMLKRNGVNTDHILTLLFGYPEINRGHMVMLLCLVDALTISDDKADIKPCHMAVGMKGEGGKRTYWSFYLDDDTNDDRSILQLKEYFRALYLACVLGHDITIDR